MTEKEIERVLVSGIKRLGGKAYKWTSPGNNGVPDRIVILPSRNPVFVEMKTEKGKTTPLQDRQIAKLRALGQDVRVLRGLEEVNRFLGECERMVGDGV